MSTNLFLELCPFDSFANLDTSLYLFPRLVKPLFDSVVALPLDDPPLALAAAAVLYFLALDVRLNAPSVGVGNCTIIPHVVELYQLC